MSNFIINSSHPLIGREQTYLLDRKIISIHSEDRDISQWPNSNNFAVRLPEDLINIQSIRLINTIFPSNYYTFTNNYQNTKLKFTVDLSGAPNTEAIAQITEGFYDPVQLMIELQNSLNNAVVEASSLTSYDGFICNYNEVKHKIFIANDRDSFILNFDEEIQYDISCGQINVWNHTVKWGLPFFLGYRKKQYNSIDISGSYSFSYQTTPWVTPVDGSNVYISEPECCLEIFGENSIYMELDKYNSIDEIAPYSKNTMEDYNNDYHGKVNSAFAKIPLQQFSFSQIFDSRNAYLTNVKVFNPPLPKLRRMKFKFRYHDGRMVDFKCMPFSFSIEVNQLRDEQRRVLNVRIPDMYNL
jgi:hypothetical protein